MFCGYHRCQQPPMFLPSAQPKVYDCRFFLFFSYLWRLLTNYWKVDFLGKNWLPQEKFTPSGKVVFLDKSWHPREKLTPSGKVESLGKSWIPRKKLTPSGKVDSLGKNWLPQEKLSPSGKDDSIGKVNSLGKSWLHGNIIRWHLRSIVAEGFEGPFLLVFF